MKTDENLIKIAGGNSVNYSDRIQALDSIKEESVLKYLAENAEDDWIKLESAIRGRILTVLRKLTDHPDERICLEAAIELNDQDRLTEIVLTSKDALLKDIAAKYVDDDSHLRKIIHKSDREKERVEAAIRLGDIPLNKNLLRELKSEDLQLRMAQYLSDFKVISDLSEHAKDKRVRKMASEWLVGIGSGQDDEID